MLLRIPISNFELENRGEIQLCNAKIIPLDKINHAIIKRASPGSKYIVEINSLLNEKPRRTLDRVLCVFKLFKDYPILSNIVFTEDGKPDHLPHYTHWIDIDRGVPPYILSNEEKIQFCEFWNEYIEINIGNFAVSRFHLADFRPYAKDRFVDYVESLEYLFVPDSGESEIAYKFRQRGSMVLGFQMNPKERREVYHHMKDAYSLRSAIVHGGNINKYTKGKTWEQITHPIRNYVKESIKFFFSMKCLEDSSKRKEILEELCIFSAKLHNTT